MSSVFTLLLKQIVSYIEKNPAVLENLVVSLVQYLVSELQSATKPSTPPAA